MHKFKANVKYVNILKLNVANNILYLCFVVQVMTFFYFCRADAKRQQTGEELNSLHENECPWLHKVKAWGEINKKYMLSSNITHGKYPIIDKCPTLNNLLE